MAHLNQPIISPLLVGRTAAQAVLDARPDEQRFTLSTSQLRLARARLALAQGNATRALALADALLADAPNRNQPGVHAAAAVLLVRAQALMTMGDSAAAETTLQQAQTSASALAATPLLWRIFAQMALLYQHRGQHSEAAASTSAARAHIDEIAQRVEDTTLRATFVARAHNQLPAMRQPRPAPAAGGLTAREAEVAALIARGLSNREIAAQLVVTERTITTHISHIFDKLDFRTRSQVAAWVARQGGQPADTAPD